MQCFTRGEKRPRTTYGAHYQEPLSHYYFQRPRWTPEPARNARPWVPEGIPYPSHIYPIKRLLVVPEEPPVHRERRMGEMLEAINETNWTTSQKEKHYGSRKSKIVDSLKYSKESTQRDHFPGYWMGKELRRHPNRFASAGAAPEVYHLVPYLKPKDHPLTLQNYDDNCDPYDPNKRCCMTTVPHYLCDPYPGTPLPDHFVKPPEKPSISKPGWVV
ncbi:uncharacterized protein LOC131950312 [Physella acuta]|uniref:uncharacterized protein LOC131950312 n=1 Tax=Physella acuta TaxID=109671 RepID=UPI0027DE280D|nr:uncharacterized protein LOC131950312 [Physella acuta]